MTSGFYFKILWLNKIKEANWQNIIIIQSSDRYVGIYYIILYYLHLKIFRRGLKEIF